MTKYGLSVLLLFVSQSVFSNEVVIKHVRMEYHSTSWTFNVTLQHPDTGWDHYADGWRVVDGKGNVLGKRTLHHPHVKEQPFTRSLSSVVIPASTRIIFVEAHDKVHGWSKDKVKIDMSKPKAERYQID